ncbi:MAG: hypothetical protein WCH34_13175 [Bacteroidota bacterium]
MKIFYFPTKAADKLQFHFNFRTEIPSIGLNLGLTQEEIDDIIADYLVAVYISNLISIVRPFSEEVTTYKDIVLDGAIGSPLGPLPVMPALPVAPTAVPAGIYKRLAATVQRIKNHKNYNESIGKTLGIIGAEQTVDEENAKPEVKVLHSNTDAVALEFVKSVFVGVIVYEGVYTKLAGSEEAYLKWTEIGRATTSPYLDKRPVASEKPEVRHYKMRYMVKDVAIGLDSDTITVIASVGI